MNEEEIKALQKQVKQIQKEYDILDGIIDIKDAVIAKLKEENERLKREFEIESLTDNTTGETIYRSNLINNLQEENERLKEENFNFEEVVKLCKCELYEQTLQEIKEIAERQMRCCTCNFQNNDYKSGCKTCESKYAREIAVETLQKITKAEEE